MVALADAASAYQKHGHSMQSASILIFICSTLELISGFAIITTAFISKWIVFIFPLGALLFGVGMMFPIRSLGVILFSYGLIKYGNAIKSKV